VTLRARLILALLSVALVPTLIFTAFTLDQLSRAISRWYRPGVERALGGALEVTKAAVTRLEATAAMGANDWARTWNSLAAGQRAEAVRASLRAAGLDFIQIYRRSGQRWMRVEQIVPQGVIVAQGADLGDEIAGALESDRIIRSVRGALAGVGLTGRGEAVVAGYWVPPDFFSQTESVGRGMTYYRQLAVTVDVQRRVLALVVAGVCLGLVALAVVLATGLAREMSRPISELSAAIERVAAGDLSTRVTPRGAFELRSLGASFNAMTGRLESAREALQQAEREAAWRDVARKLAHEFKNILTPMQLSLQLLECQVEAIPESERGEAEKSLEALMREVEGLKHLSEQFSQYARLPEPRFERLDLAEVVRAATGFVPGANLRLSPSGTAGPVVRGDRLLLSRAIHNLLLNACEASPPDRPVEVCTSVAGREARVEILDRGPGLPEALRQRLFEPYVSTKKRGSGLGLSLVRDIARQHGGQATLEDRPGGGARARLSLPLAAVEPPGAGA
jgi:nitrogen fixation/metabolism regulation signal transduction histidine kinase